MNLRAPAVPLFNVDPYFSVWSASDRLTDSVPIHWTGKPNTFVGAAVIDGKTMRFMGVSEEPAMAQTGLKIDALSTAYTFEGGGVILEVIFTSPRLPDTLYLLSLPVAYMGVTARSADGKKHSVKVALAASEELCLDVKGQSETVASSVSIDGLACIKIGNKEQKPLWRSGDDVRIDWGYFYLAVKGADASVTAEKCDMVYVSAKADISERGALFILAYDDIYSIQYFGENIKSWWNRGGETIETAIEKAAADYDSIYARCAAFSDKLFLDATRAGGEKYAEICSLAWRQVMAAHKVAADPDGNVVFISKECFSNGCAATVDVSYPSIPMFLIYNPELVIGMMRPILKYALSGKWPFDFAPHDAGQYPLVNGQVYSGTDIRNQMPVEECGNMLVMAAATAVAIKDASFFKQYMPLFETWTGYLLAHGADPEHQLCTDDFAGHLAHNCNLSVKAIVGLAGYAILCKMTGDCAGYDKYMAAAKTMAEGWVKNAANGDGSFRLAFDRPGTFSMKYNAVWDKLFGTGLFPRMAIESELASNLTRLNPYGMPLDTRAAYTKSDWLMWTATLASSREVFTRFCDSLWNAYNYSRSRVPLTDWYDTVTGDMVGFRHRTVQGGLFIKLLEYTGKMNISEVL